MIRLTYISSDAALAAQIEADMRAAGLIEGQNALVAVLSPDASGDAAVQESIAAAVYQGQRVIPVLATPTALPKLIEHLEAVDFSGGYNFERLRERLSYAPSVRKINRFDGYFLIAVVLFCFIVGLFLIAGGVIRNPDQEYNLVDTEVALTRNYYVDSNLPHSTQEAAEFPSTVQAAPPALRPLLVMTATAEAEK